jgi:hypothetical protein
MSRVVRSCCVILGALAAACADAQDPRSSSFGQAIMRGEASGEEDNAVVRISSRQPSPYEDFTCSGVLVAPNLVLTALSCAAVNDSRDQNFTCEADGTASVGQTGGWLGGTLEPQSIEVFFGSETSFTAPIAVHARGVRIFGSESSTACRDDIAFVLLDTLLPSPGLPVRLKRPVLRGENLTLIGYGLNDVNALRSRRSGVPVLEVGPDDTSEGQGLAYPRTFTVGDGPCSSDGGGPALSDETGAVVGIFAHNFGGSCQEPGTGGWFTKIAPYATLLQTAFEAAGVEPLVEAALAEPAAARESSCAITRAFDRRASVEVLFALLGVLATRRRAGGPLRFSRRS